MINPAAVAAPRSAEALLEWWQDLPESEQIDAFLGLSPQEAGILFLTVETSDRVFLLEPQTEQQKRVWLRLLEPDDAADVIQGFEEDEQGLLLALLDYHTRSQVQALLAYRSDVAGGKMSPRYVRVPPSMTAEQAIGYLRLQAQSASELIYYAYVLDREDRLLGVVSYRDLMLAPPDRQVSEIMSTDTVSVLDDMDQEEVARILRQRGLLAVPVVDHEGHMRGIVTVDDVVDVEREEATEDFQKIGGVEALDQPYFRTSALSMIRKRGGWLAVLFVGQMLTVTALGMFEGDLASAVVLALFIPIIISSGGNSGSQAATLIIRAMALGEVNGDDWWRVIRREVIFGLALGAMLAGLGALRVLIGGNFLHSYGEDFVLLALTVSLSVTAVVVWGTLTGATLPFLLRRAGFDPASASAPLVATLMDVTGLLIYLSLARIILLG
ncbi:MAG: magnesium transporter [Chloroflexi bacterium]|nr:magnesium transporter [Chloroflexota bacterium]MQC16732.1 magnesium transporter [Chloroflexota bacterium]